MRVTISGICGFVGSTLAAGLCEADSGLKISGFDNFIRPGSETNRARLRDLGVTVTHADIRSATDLENLPESDWVIDAAALPSVLGGVDGRSSSRQLIEHNLNGTINLLEYCRKHRAGFILLSTSRVYSIPPLLEIPLRKVGGAFSIDDTQILPTGVTVAGVNEKFSTAPPVSLYGSTKVASEILALEYGSTFGFPVWVNRCGVLAGAGQFGQAEQGIFSFWIHSWKAKNPLRYIGFDGTGAQVRDALHPSDLCRLLRKQMGASTGDKVPRIVNVSGGRENSMSLAELSNWCENRFGPGSVTADSQTRPFDVPWLVLDASTARKEWDWAPATPLNAILEEIAVHACAHPEWLSLSRQ